MSSIPTERKCWIDLYVLCVGMLMIVLDATRHIVGPTMLGRAATLEDVGSVTAFVAFDHARTMPAATVNISCGALID